MQSKEAANAIVDALVAKDVALTFEVYTRLRKDMSRWATPWKLTDIQTYTRFSVKSGAVCARVYAKGNVWAAAVLGQSDRTTQPSLTQALTWCEAKLNAEGWTILPGISGVAHGG